MLCAGCWFACQRAALFRATVLAYEKWPIRASLRPLGVYIYALRNCGFVPKPCFCGLSARLSASPLKTLRVFRRLCGPKQSRAWHLWSSSARCSGARPHTPLAAMLRRRDTVSSPCDVSHRASDEPRRCMSLSSALAPSSLASPSIRRVFVRSFCARRRPVSSLNRAAYPPERSGVAEGELNAGCKSVAPSWRISEASASPRQIRRDFVRTIISFHRALILLFDGERANVV